MHNAAFIELGLPYQYTPLDIQPEKLAEIIETKIKVNSFGGASVTIPHKIAIMEYMDELAESAIKAGAVNTLEFNEGILRGHNTDGTGGVRALEEVFENLSAANVVLLGAGGAANALASELVLKVKEITILNRTLETARKLSERLDVEYGSLYDDLTVIESADILINTTPLGMIPHVAISPVDMHYLHSELLVYDIIYNPMKTRLMLDAEKIGARTLGGLWMLVYQGVEAFKIWTGIEPRAKTMYKAALESLEAMNH
jgi:shikimate dehydrogenase